MVNQSNIFAGAHELCALRVKNYRRKRPHHHATADGRQRPRTQLFFHNRLSAQWCPKSCMHRRHSKTFAKGLESTYCFSSFFQRKKGTFNTPWVEVSSRRGPRWRNHGPPIARWLGLPFLRLAFVGRTQRRPREVAKLWAGKQGAICW